MTPDIRATFDAIPPAPRDVLLQARALILDCATGAVDECLRWGQVSYLAPKGTALRLGLTKGGQPAIFAHCQSRVISDFAAQFGSEFEIEGNRAVLLGAFSKEDQEKLRSLIVSGLTYKA